MVEAVSGWIVICESAWEAEAAPFCCSTDVVDEAVGAAGDGGRRVVLIESS